MKIEQIVMFEGKTDEFRFDFVKAIYWFNKTISANANSLSAQNATIKSTISNVNQFHLAMKIYFFLINRV